MQGLRRDVLNSWPARMAVSARILLSENAPNGSQGAFFSFGRVICSHVVCDGARSDVVWSVIAGCSDVSRLLSIIILL